MAVLTIDLDEVTAFGEVVDDGLFQVELVAHLVEIRHFQLGAALDLACGRLQVTEHHLQQGGLAGTVGTQQADTVLALQDHGEVLDQQRAIGVMEADVFQHHHLLAGFVRRFDLDVRLALAFAALAALDAQGLECTHTAFVAGTPGLDALANPHFFLGQALVEQRIGGFFGGQRGFLVHQEAGVVAVPVDQAAAVQFEDARGEVLQEGTVVGDEQHGTVETAQGFFEPGDGPDVQVVGRLVEQQQIRLGHQRLGQQHAAAPATGELGQGLVGGQLQAAQGAFHHLLQAPAVAGFELVLNVHELFQICIAVDVLAQVMKLGEQLADAIQACRDHIEHRTLVGNRQLLWQLADLQARGAPDLAIVALLLALDQAQHARFAGAVTADDAHPLATGDLPGHFVQQRHRAECEGHIAEFEQGHVRLQKAGAHST